MAATVAAAATLTDSFGGTAARLIGTSLGFSVFSALGASGGAARRRPTLAGLGRLTLGAAGLAFVLLEVAMWIQTTGWPWRAFGVVAVVALATSHSSLVLGARRTSDGAAVRMLVALSVVTAAVDTILAAIGIAGFVGHVTSGEIRLSAILIIAMLLSTALPPVLRRVAHPAPRPDADGTDVDANRAGASGQLQELATRLDALAPATGLLADELHREASRLRDLAGRVSEP